MRSVLNLAVGQGEIRLDPANPAGHPIIDFNMLVEDEFDRRRLREALRLCVRLGGHPAFAGILGDRASRRPTRTSPQTRRWTPGCCAR